MDTRHRRESRKWIPKSMEDRLKLLNGDDLLVYH